MQLVTVRGVEKSVGEGRARRLLLEDAAIDVQSGEMVAILGRSGSGKSTLLNLLGGIDRADSGSIEVAGQRVDRLDDAGLTKYRRDHIGFIFQMFHLIPELNAEENVLLPARISGSRADSEARARQLMARFGVADIARQLPHTLSGGEQQRIAIARALVNDASLILADEPTGNLDSVAAEVVLADLRRICESGRSVVLVTHERSAAERADRVLWLDGRRLVPG